MHSGASYTARTCLPRRCRSHMRNINDCPSCFFLLRYTIGSLVEWRHEACESQYSGSFVATSKRVPDERGRATSRRGTMGFRQTAGQSRGPKSSQTSGRKRGKAAKGRQTPREEIKASENSSCGGATGERRGVKEALTKAKQEAENEGRPSFRKERRPFAAMYFPRL